MSNLCETETGLLLLILDISLPPLTAPPPHLLGLPQAALPGALVGRHWRCDHHLSLDKVRVTFYISPLNNGTQQKFKYDPTPPASP